MTKEQEQAIEYLKNDIEKRKQGRNYFIDYNEVMQHEEIILNLIQQLQEEKKYVGLKVRNKISGKCGIVLHINSSGSIAVLESIEPKVVNTHDSWKTLEVIQNNIFKRK